MAKAPESHQDILGREIKPGSFVVANWWGGDLRVCVVKSISPKMVRISQIKRSSGFNSTKNKYPDEVCLIDNQEDITMYILKNGAK